MRKKRILALLLSFVVLLGFAMPVTAGQAAGADPVIEHAHDEHCDHGFWPNNNETDPGFVDLVTDAVMEYMIQGYSLDIVWTTLDGRPTIYVVSPDGIYFEIDDAQLPDGFEALAQEYFECMTNDPTKTFAERGICCGVWRTRRTLSNSWVSDHLIFHLTLWCQVRNTVWRDATGWDCRPQDHIITFVEQNLHQNPRCNQF